VDTAPQTLAQSLRWIVFDFLSARRRWQILGVLGIMLVGGAAELFTIAAVVPLLAMLAGAGSPGHSQVTDMLRATGLDVSRLPLGVLAAIFCAAAVASAAVRIVLTWSSQKLVFRIGYDLSVSLYSRVLHQPYDFHVRINSSRIISDITGIQRLLTGMILPLMQGLSSFVISLFILAGLLVISTKAALIAFVGIGTIYAIVSLWSRPRLRRIGVFIKTTSRARVKTVQEGLGGIRDVLLDNTQSLYVKKFCGIESKLRDAQAETALVGVAPRFIVEALGMVVIVGLALILTAQGSIQTSLPVLAALALRRRQQVGSLVDDQEHGAESEAIVLRKVVPAVDAVIADECLPGLSYSHELLKRLHLLVECGYHRHVEPLEPGVLAGFLWIEHDDVPTRACVMGEIAQAGHRHIAGDGSRRVDGGVRHTCAALRIQTQAMRIQAR
jgi:ABC-type multidrug transport system fused ATPase/permease subunit